MSHEQSETIQDESGRWRNIYGEGPARGLQLPLEPYTYATREEAESAARIRSETFPQAAEPNLGQGLSPSGGGFADLASRIAQTDLDLKAAREQRAKAQQDEQAAIERAKTGTQPAREAATKALTAPMPAPPEPLALPQPPSRGLHDFLAPTPGESPENTITKLIQGVTLLATGFTGLARKDATSALASMKGALEGWQAGDKQRADRAFSDWKAQTDKLIEEQQSRLDTFRNLVTERKLTGDELMRALEIESARQGYELMKAKVATGQADAVVQEITQQQNHLDQLRASNERLAAMHEERERDRDLRQRLADQAQDTRLAIAASNQQARAQHDANATAAKEAKADDKKAQKAAGQYYDFATGKTREISIGQWQENNDRINSGGTPLYRHLSEANVQLVDRLAVAAPVLDRLDALITKINSAAPGENITQGLINKLKQKAGLDADIQEIMTLNLDNALENAAALSGGQPRIAILQMLRGEATPGLSMTQDVARRLIDTTRTTIKNRMASTTGDPQAFEKASRDLQKYGKKAGEPSLTAGWKIEVVK